MSKTVDAGIGAGLASGAETTMVANEAANAQSALNNFTNMEGKGRKQSETITGG